MKQSILDLLRSMTIGGLLIAASATFAPAHAYDTHDQRWRDHQQHERDMALRYRGHGHWDHGYWDRDDTIEVYHPPVVIYAPPPPTGLDFVFRFGR